MFVDTSAVVAMLAGEPEAASFAQKLEAAAEDFRRSRYS
jgi:uncharacterized protein with PIN domain